MGSTFRLAQKMDETLELLGLSGSEIIKYSENVKVYKAPSINLLGARITDQLICYLGDIIGEIYLADNRTLSSSETLTVKEIVQSRSKEELIEFLAQRRVDRISRKGFSEIWDEAIAKLGIDKINYLNFFENINLAIHIRNLFVHNHSKIDSRFIDSHPAFSAKLGEEIGFDGNLHLINTCAKFVAKFDTEVATKFQLAREQSNSAINACSLIT